MAIVRTLLSIVINLTIFDYFFHSKYIDSSIKYKKNTRQNTQ